jgi:hypothetical protein
MIEPSHDDHSKIRALRALAADLDEDDLSLEIHNASPTEWSVHVYASRSETPVVKSGDDLAFLMTDAIETWKRRHVVSQLARGRVEEGKGKGKK